MPNLTEHKRTEQTLTVSVDDLKEDFWQELNPDGEPGKAGSSADQSSPHVQPLLKGDGHGLEGLRLVLVDGLLPGDVHEFLVFLTSNCKAIILLG